MKIDFYCISFPDDLDTLPDALDSAARFADRLYLSDGGFSGALCHHPRYTTPLIESMFGKKTGEEGYGNRTLRTSWKGVPLTLFEHPFQDPAHARNWLLNRMAQESEQPDFIYWHDADEVASWELIKGIRPGLESLPSSVTNVCLEWLTLVQDEQHYFPDHSKLLAHARIHRPGMIQWHGQWHEDMGYVGERENWTLKVIHTRELLRKRLWIQRGHPTLRDGWKNVTCEPLPNGLATWPVLHYSPDELLPFDQDASTIWNKDGTPIT